MTRASSLPARPESHFNPIAPTSPLAIHLGGLRRSLASNSLKNGLLPICLAPEIVAELRRQLHAQIGASVTVDLVQQTVTGPDGREHGFDIDPLQKRRLLEGLDDLALTQRYQAEFETFERGHRAAMPWLYVSQRATSI